MGIYRGICFVLLKFEEDDEKLYSLVAHHCDLNDALFIGKWPSQVISIAQLFSSFINILCHQRNQCFQPTLNAAQGL